MTIRSDTVSPPRPSFQADSPSALLAVVPHLLGFMPGSSVVVIGTEPPRGTVKVTLRYDLPGPADDQAASDIARHALAVLNLLKLTAVAAVGYGPAALVTPVAAGFRGLTEHSGTSLVEFLRAQDGRYWSYLCANQACCPPDGTPFDAAEHPVPAALASAMPVLPDRDAVAASIAPLTGTAATSMQRATRRADQHRTRTLAAARDPRAHDAARQALTGQGLAAVTGLITAYRDGGQYTTDYQLARLIVALTDKRVRDDAWARMDPGHNSAHRRMWTDVVRHALPGYVAASASLLAFTAWQAGNGALANVALDRALADDPGYAMAVSLRTLVNAGAPPSMATCPMTPEQVAAYYDGQDHGAQPDIQEQHTCHWARDASKEH